MTHDLTNADRCACLALSSYPGEWPTCVQCDDPVCPRCQTDAGRCDACNEAAFTKASERDAASAGAVSAAALARIGEVR